VRLVDGSLGELVGQDYVARYFPPASKAKMVELVGNLKAAMADRIRNNSWMSAATKTAAVEKLARMDVMVGYPDKFRDYSKLEIRPDDLFGNVERASRFNADYQMEDLGKPVNHKKWFMNPQTVNAYNGGGENEIVFPAGILQPPFFDAEADDAANYGAIGSVIGHEISHAFDDHGSQFDGEGNLRNWWTKEDRERFEKQTHVLVAQYDAFSPLPGYHVNGALTLGENVADNAGLAIAVRAYRLARNGCPAPVIDGFSGEQRLFLSFAQIWHEKLRDPARIERLKVDPHSPGQFRADGTLRNQSSFIEAFDVKPGDAMYLPKEERISLWQTDHAVVCPGTAP
jgi:predicted metalloendopeptidase